MDLELGLKISHTIDHASSTDVRIANDKSGPLFASKETESTFILIAHLRGYRRESIQIDINEIGTQICISGEKPVQEKVMLEWIMYKKEVEMRGFRKVFRIPYGVLLDQIRARFNEHESTLTVVMPKLVKGIRGVRIEELKEEAVDIGGKQMRQPKADEVPQKDSLREENEREFREPEKKKREENGGHRGKGIDEEESKNEIVADEVLGKDIRGGKMQEEAKYSIIQSMQETPEFAAQKSEEPKIATMEEADGIDKKKSGRKELDPQQMVAGKTIKEDRSTEATPEVVQPLHQTHPTEHDTETKDSELSILEEKMIQKSPEAEKEMPKAQLEGSVYRRPETGESSEREGDTVTTQQETPVEHKETGESSEREGDTVTTQQETPVEHKETANEISKEDVDQLQNEEPTKEGPSSSRKDEIEAAEDSEEYIKEKEVDKCASSESDKRGDMVEKSSDDLEKKPDSEKSNLLCSPFIIAGSALIVSLVMLAIDRIKTRKR